MLGVWRPPDLAIKQPGNPPFSGGRPLHDQGRRAPFLTGRGRAYKDASVDPTLQGQSTLPGLYHGAWGWEARPVRFAPFLARAAPRHQVASDGTGSPARSHRERRRMPAFTLITQAEAEANWRAHRWVPGISAAHKEAVLAALEPVNGRAPTLATIGVRLGVSRERARQLVKKFGIHKPRSSRRGPASHYCSKCGRYLNNRQFECARCSPVIWGRNNYFYSHQEVKVTCGWCESIDWLPLGIILARLRPNPRRLGPRRWPLFCSKLCSGAWLGTHSRGRRKESHAP